MKIQNPVWQSIATTLGVAIFIFTGATSSAETTELASVTRVPLSQVKHGRTKLPSFVRVLSFDELMRLSKPKRVAYIRGLRAMMRELDRNGGTRSASLEGVSRSQIAALLSLFESEALALSTTTPGTPYVENGAVTCGDGYRAVHPRSFGAGADSSDATPTNYLCSIRKTQSTDPCPKGTIPVAQDRTSGGFFCATFDSWKNLPTPNQRSNARANTAAASNSATASVGNKNFNDPQFPSQEQIKAKAAADARMSTARTRTGDALSFKTPPGVKIPTPQNAGAPAGGAALAATAPGRMSAEKYADRPPIVDLKAPSEIPTLNIPAPKLDAKGNVIPSDAKVASGGPSDKPTSPPPGSAGGPPSPPDQKKAPPVPADGKREEKAAGSPADDSKSDVVVEAVGKPGDKKDDSAAAATADTKECSPEAETAKTCNAAEVEAARRKYASDPDQDCIYAGGISTYEGGTKRAYHCQAPHDFCFSGDCTSDSSEKAKPDYSCSGTQVLCNPLLFGIQADGKSPFCIAKSAHATAACDAASGDDAVSPLDQKHAGIREAWNDFADRLFKMCHTNQTAAALHCNECGVISKRLFAMNLAARDVKSCGAAIKYEASNCDADGTCSVRPGQGDPDGKKSPRGNGKVTSTDDVEASPRKPASWKPGHE